MNKEKNEDIIVQVGMVLVAGTIVIVGMLIFMWICAILRGDVNIL